MYFENDGHIEKRHFRRDDIGNVFKASEYTGSSSSASKPKEEESEDLGW